MLTSSRRQFLKTLSATAGSLLMPFDAINSFAGRHTVMMRPTLAVCRETVQPLLDLAATLEALSTTFYYQAITTADGFFGTLPTSYQRYLQVALDEEWFHYHHLTEQHSAKPGQNAFHFPTNVFAAGQFAKFLAILDTLEMAALAFYLAAIRQLSEVDEPTLAALYGQIAGIEAEHRVIGREMAQNSPPAPNNLCYESANFGCAAEVNDLLAAYLQGGAGFSGPVAQPDQALVASAVGASTCEIVAAAPAAICTETLADLFNTLATAEALGVTFYYHAIGGAIFQQLNRSQQWYLQAALDEERHHLVLWLAQGAASPPTHFFLPATVFDDLPQFLRLLDQLENVFISAYLTVIQHFHTLEEPLLAAIAGQILGVESEHRVLGRVLQGQKLPHNRCLAQNTYQCVSEAGIALDPFIAGSAAFTLEKAYPTSSEIDQAVDRFGCMPVSPATVPADLYLPFIVK